MTEAKNPYQEVIKAILDHPELHRSAILLYLALVAAGGEGRVSQLAEAMDMPRNTGALAASDLVNAGLVTRSKGVLKINMKI